MDSSITNFTSYDVKNLNQKIKCFEGQLMELWTQENHE
jgi:hypothetical protein